MDPSFLLKQSMGDTWVDYANLIDDMQLGLNEPHHSQKRTSETCTEDGEHTTQPDSYDDFQDNLQDVPALAVNSGSASQTLQPWDTGLLPWPQSNNQLGINNGVVTAQASQPTNISSHNLLKRNVSNLSESDRAERKKKNDKVYRQRCKKHKEDMQFSLEALKGENDSLKKENESLKKDNTMMKGTLRDQAKEIDRLRNDLFQLKRECEKQNVLVQTLSGLVSDPVRLENEKLKDENASLRKNANLNNSMLAEENAKLRTENKVLKVQNDALCGKIISDNDKKHEQKQ